MKDLSTLAKLLASDQMKVRKRAQFEVENMLSKEASNEAALPTYAEMLAVCKGLHYTLWMQDKLLLKEEVVKRICHILPMIPHPGTRLHYINAMFETLAREWDRLDNWRVDKFMLLTRDFFTQALHSLVPVDCDLWDSILDAVFEKILNADIQHAVGLKMHMCTVLGEELSRKKVKSFCIVTTLVHLVSRLTELPRHHSYAHNILRVIHTLLGTLRRRSTPNTKQLLDKLTILSSQRGKHFKSLRRITTIVRAITDKAAKNGKQNQMSPSGQSGENDSTVPILPTSAIPPPSCSVVPSAQKSSKKRKKTSKQHDTAHKKRRVNEDSTEQSIVDISTNTNTISVPLEGNMESKETSLQMGSVEQCKITTDGNEVTEQKEPEITHDSIQSCLDESIPVVPQNTPILSSTPQNVIDGTKRRVSFGKVFRKRFIASQRLSMTPTVTPAPKKGILRDQTQVRSRLSI